MILKAGDTFTSYPSGGGGWGAPESRDPEAVRMDVINEIISLESATTIYKVVLEGEDFQVNVGKTSELRK